MGDHDELITIPGRWEFEYEYFAGETASRFFAELRERRRIMGTVCESCARTLVPARSFCDACFVPTSGWREVGRHGVLETFTILATAFPGLPEPPLVIAYVTLEGADTAILNHVTGLDLTDLDAAAEILMRRPAVEVAFVPEPQGRITDFHFTLAEGT
jgi:uncharacterized protein